MGDTNTLGCAYPCWKKQACFIRILDWGDYEACNDEIQGWEYDMEQTLVHELLHIRFEPFTPKSGTLQYDLWEQTVDVLASSLVAAYRSLP